MVNIQQNDPNKPNGITYMQITYMQVL
ncbi:uncharacterized protein METZ01_LOCUS140299 [marine metagenome]|uniref:Uncharacterized protein n=1 Tax=marine metagenome TaxID=408172 RepID=A0A381ZDR3_9ZZZZ